MPFWKSFRQLEPIAPLANTGREPVQLGMPHVIDCYCLSEQMLKPAMLNFKTPKINKFNKFYLFKLIYHNFNYKINKK